MKTHLEYISPTALRHAERNARTHSKKQIGQIASSMSEFGFTNPILIDQNNVIIAGHGRLAAANQLGLAEVPCIRLVHLSDAQKRGLAIADNKIALNSGWDEEILAGELKILSSLDIDFSLDVTGFSIAEIDTIIEIAHKQESGDPADDAVVDTAVPVRVKPGDLWQLGQHRLVCGDALDPEVVATLMGGEKARMVFTDPPYNVAIQGHVGGSGAIKHREFAMASGEMTNSQFTGFLRTSFQNLVAHARDGAIHFICMDWRHVGEVLAASDGVYSEFKNLIVWAKDNGGMGTFYRSRHELIFAFKQGKASHINTFELGQHGRYRTNVWEYAGVNTMRSGRLGELALHPTVKPVQMIADAIKDVSGRGDIVLDLFGGSGSTLIAAHKTGRRGYLCEIDALYCDRIIHRWETYAGEDARLINCTADDAAADDWRAAA